MALKQASQRLSRPAAVAARPPAARPRPGRRLHVLGSLRPGRGRAAGGRAATAAGRLSRCEAGFKAIYCACLPKVNVASVNIWEKTTRSLRMLRLDTMRGKFVAFAVLATLFTTL